MAAAKIERTYNGHQHREQTSADTCHGQFRVILGVDGGGVGGGMSGTATGSSHVKVMFSSLSSGRLKAFLMASVNCLYPSGPGRTSKLYVRPSKLTFMTAGAFAPHCGVRVFFQSGS